MQYQLLALKGSIGLTMRKHDSTAYSLYSLCDDYTTEILALDQLNFSSDLIGNEEPLNAGDVFNITKAEWEFAKGVRNRLALDSLISRSNYLRNEVFQKHEDNQVKWNNRLDKLRSKLGSNQQLQFWLYVIGVILLAVDRGLKGLVDEQRDAEIKQSFNKLIHTTHEISNKV